MYEKAAVYALAAIAALTALPSALGADDPMIKQLVDKTTQIRAAHGLGPVSWDADKAAKVQAYANSCPGFKHSDVGGFENLAPFTPCKSEDECLKDPGASWMWYDDEETKWDYGGATCTTGNWADCGHFSNMMGPNVKSIGCGWSECPDGNYVWCHYEGGAETAPKVPQRSTDKAELHKQLQTSSSATQSQPAPAPVPAPEPETQAPAPVEPSPEQKEPTPAPAPAPEAETPVASEEESEATPAPDAVGLVHGFVESATQFAQNILDTLKDEKTVALLDDEVKQTLSDVVASIGKVADKVKQTQGISDNDDDKDGKDDTPVMTPAPVPAPEIEAPAPVEDKDPKQEDEDDGMPVPPYE